MPREKYSNNTLLKPNIIGGSIRTLRKERNMTQAELAKAIQLMLDSPEELSNLSISAYENGVRIPPLTTMIAISQILGSTLDYMCGLKTKISESVARTENGEESPFYDAQIEISGSELKKFDRQAVYAMFTRSDIESRWCILDYEGQRLLCAEAELPLDSSVRLFRVKPVGDEKVTSYNYVPLTAPQVMEYEILWVESIASDAVVRGRYTGYYRHNENRTGLINVDNGLFLEYKGVGVYYMAFYCS